MSSQSALSVNDMKAAIERMSEAVKAAEAKEEQQRAIRTPVSKAKEAAAATEKAATKAKIEAFEKKRKAEKEERERLEKERKKKEQAKKDRLEKIEMGRRELDKQEAEIQAMQRKDAIERAQRMLYEDSDKVKTFSSGMLLSACSCAGGLTACALLCLGVLVLRRLCVGFEVGHAAPPPRDCGAALLRRRPPEFRGAVL